MKPVIFDFNHHNARLTMSSRLIAKLTGKDHKHVLRDCLNMFEELGLDTIGYVQNWTYPQNGQSYKEYLLTKDLVETLITGYSIKLLYEVIQQLRELENQLTPKVLLPQDLPNALRALANTHEQLQRAQIEHDVAIKTKAYISDKKTTTAMATAGCALRENRRLKDKWGKSTDNATVLAVERLTKKVYAWQALNKWFKAHGVKPKKVHDDRYGKVNTYPSQAWQEVYNVNLSALFGGL